VKRLIIGGLTALAIGVGTLAGTGAANAFPGLGYCPGGGGGFGSFGYCDGPTYPDGSYDHTVAAMGGWMSSRVCPPDPANPAIPLPWLPDQQCAFRK
jgi:hypothetical protein